MMKKITPAFAVLILSFVLLWVCAEATPAAKPAGEPVQSGTQGGSAGQAGKQDPFEIFGRVVRQLESAARPMTEKEEYYVGRAVAAQILERYRVVQDSRIMEYVNLVGNAMALASDVPYTYGGYHFAVLDTSEVNAFSCPGGIVFVTRGMLSRAGNEEELAAILAHEIAHVNNRDGIQAIQQSRWVEVVSMLGGEAVKGKEGINKLTLLFEGSVNDVVRTLIVNGYSQDQERAADASALNFLNRAGYDPIGLADYLERLSREQEAGNRGGFFSTHPGMSERLGLVRSAIASNGWKRIDHRIRDRRFGQYMK